MPAEAAESPLELFDCDVLAGPTMREQHPGLDPASLHTELARCGIRRALIYTHAFGPCAWEEQNRHTRDLVANHPGFVPCAVLPQHGHALGTGVLPEVELLLAGVIRSFRLDPEIGPASGPLTLECFPQSDVIWSRLASHRTPVLIPGAHLPEKNRRFGYDLGDITTLCRRQPNLPVVLLNPPYALQHLLAHALDAAANLHVSISRLGIFGQLESFVRTFGASRFLFGSGLPFNDPAIPAGALRYADLAPADLRLIASGNLERLLTPP